MGIADHPLLDLMQKVKSWIFGPSGSTSESLMSGCGDHLMCYECRAGFGGSVQGHRCRSCWQMFCRTCMQSGGGSGSRVEQVEQQPKYCKFCFRAISGHGEVAVERRAEKVSPLVSPECISKSPLSGSMTNNRLFAGPPEPQQSSSPRRLCCSTCRSEEEEVVDESGKQFLSPLSLFSQDVSDIDTISSSTGNEIYSFKSITPSPLDSPSRAVEQADVSPITGKIGLFDQDSPGYLRKLGGESEDLLEHGSNCTYDNFSIYQNQESQKAQQPLDFANNWDIWYPPPPEDKGDDVEAGFFEYDDEDDEVGDSGKLFTSSGLSSDVFRIKEKANEAQKELLRNGVHGHFRALVSQLLKGEAVHVGSENGGEGWLEVVSSLAWQAANFVKPNSSKGDSMDPGDYVKVKCVASGRPMDSTLIKGVVCTKNIKHKRMVSQHKNPRLLLLGGALEYQKVPNKLASINTVLEQEIDHLKMAVGKLEAHRPNVLLVEKSVSSYAQEYLLAKEISLVLNVKRPLLERISRCTGAQIVPSIDNLASARLGHCEMFRIEKVSEECSSANHPNKKSVKTLMFFEGCPRRLGCTVLLRGTCLGELKKVKHVVQLASFAAYHLSLETSFLADEGATLPEIPLKPPLTMTQKPMDADAFVSMASSSAISDISQTSADKYQGAGSGIKLGTECLPPSSNVLSLGKCVEIRSEQQECKLSSDCMNSGNFLGSSPTYTQNHRDFTVDSTPDIPTCGAKGSISAFQCKEPGGSSHFSTDVGIHQGEMFEKSVIERTNLANHKNLKSDDEYKRTCVDDEVPTEYLSTAENRQSILVSLSSTCISKGTVCEHFQLFRIKFYGSFDKPLGRYLRDDLFDQTSCCHICKEPAEGHVRCYTHQQGSLSIYVRRLPSMKLAGEQDGRIWMWHRCLKCELKDGIPPAAHRVVMSHAALGLSFGKFLELSFSNHVTANRIAICGHSLQRDCLRFYGFGSMVAFFRYSPVDVLSVNLPPSTLDFTCQIQQELARKEVTKISNKVEFLHAEVSDMLQGIENKITISEHEPLKESMDKHITDLKNLLKMERNEYEVLLQAVKTENIQLLNASVDILELNRLRRSLLLNAYMWDRRLYLLDSLSRAESYTAKVDPNLPDIFSLTRLKEWGDELFSKDGQLGNSSEKITTKPLALSGTPRKSKLSKQHEESSLQVVECNSSNMVEMDLSIESIEGYVGPASLNLVSGQCNGYDERMVVAEASMDASSVENLPSPSSNLSDQIDLAWTGSGQLVTDSPKGGAETDSVGSSSLLDYPCYKKVISPVRGYSFDSALKFRDRVHGGGLSPLSLQLTSFRSFDAPGDIVSTFKDPILNMRRAYSQRSHRDIQRLNIVLSQTPIYISSASRMVSDGARLLLPRTGVNDVVVAVYDDEPSSIISYAMTSQEYANFIASRLDQHEELNGKEKMCSLQNQMSSHSAAMNFADQESVAQYQLNDIQSWCCGSEETQLSQEKLSDPKESHFRIYFGDESLFTADKAKYSVTCYFARQFDALRKKCCPNELDYIRSLSRCKRWSAQGGKSNVYFAKSLDGRFIIKQVTKTELDSFEDFAPEYFKYLTESITSGSPTCLAKILGIYQVTVKHLKGGREVRMDLMVMENLFFRRNISRVYDLKGSLRSRYNPDTSGNNRVLLDVNLLETLSTKPIFLGSNAKRRLERAVWNDTSFLASVDVMDYSLLVGIDEDRKELVIGIIDFMRQYTWDKHLETWVKASGILGGPKNASPTVISPMQYKKRFRKAMSKYFLTVPDQWS